jgi:ATP-binding protein involved in chromosome partitioning
MNNEIQSYKIKNNLAKIPNIKNIIAITSGKGGVGKSTNAFNLAIELQKKGYAIGLLDADIYGPSIPTIIGEKNFKPEVQDNNFIPITKFDIKIMSFGFLIDSSQPAIWRGAIVNKAINQLLYDTTWGNLDILIIDMPPGTGDIHLTMCQKFPITATICITTPQDLALVDVIKSINMFKKLDIPCIGFIENMSTHICKNCGYEEEMFGNNAANKLVQEYNLDFLGKIPLDINIRLSADHGNLIKDEKINEQYNEISNAIINNLKKLPRDYSDKLGILKIIKN